MTSIPDSEQIHMAAGLQVTIIMIVSLIYLIGVAELVHRIWVAASNCEFGGKPIHPLWVPTLYSFGLGALVLGLLGLLPILVAISWWFG